MLLEITLNALTEQILGCLLHRNLYHVLFFLTIFLKHSPVLIQTKYKYLWRKTNSAAFHTDFQTVWRFATGIHDATIHVTRAVTVIPHFIPTATAAGFWGADTTWSLSQDNIAEGQEFTEQAGQDRVDTAIFIFHQKETT